MTDSAPGDASDTPRQEIRQDLITRQWVICAPARNHRPHQTADSDAPAPDDATPVEGCPFCPGHESMLPSVIQEVDHAPDGPWMTRVVPNKYPALTPDPSPDAQACGLYRVRGGFGRQEVIIDTPFHHQPLGVMSARRVEGVVATYLQRYRAIRQNGDELFPFVFRNHGADAGASLPHPHSQIIAVPLPPPDLQHEEAQAEARYHETGRCPYCEMIEEELAAEARVVWSSDRFVVFVPYAARAPYEMWILPREHEPEFGRLSDADRADFADALRTATHAMHHRLGDPDFNFFVRTAIDYESDAPHLHWSLRIRPRTTVDAGFELGTGLRINPSLPERDAAVLRGEL